MLLQTTPGWEINTQINTRTSAETEIGQCLICIWCSWGRIHLDPAIIRDLAFNWPLGFYLRKHRSQYQNGKVTRFWFCLLVQCLAGCSWQVYVLLWQCKQMFPLVSVLMLKHTLGSLCSEPMKLMSILSYDWVRQNQACLLKLPACSFKYIFTSQSLPLPAS